MGSQVTTEELTARLAAPFELEWIKWKPAVVSGERAMALPYLDARAVQERLDDVLGIDGWQDDYQFLDDGNVVCRLRLKIGGEWIQKMDVGGQSEQPDEGDRRKAAVSDALKRAAVKFGIGRYLYRLPRAWVNYDPKKKCIVAPPPLPDWAVPGGNARQATRREAPAPRTGPQQEANGNGHASPGKPKDGKELLARLAAKEDALVRRAHCKPGQLITYVFSVGSKAGHKGKIGEWGPDAVDLAIRAVREFETATEAGNEIRRLGNRLGWSAVQLVEHVARVYGDDARPDALTAEQASQLILALEDELQLRTASRG